MASRGATAGVSLLKRGWNEVPELVLSLSMAGVGILLSGALLSQYNPYKSHQHKKRYTVIRPDEVKNEEMQKYCN